MQRREIVIRPPTEASYARFYGEAFSYLEHITIIALFQVAFVKTGLWPFEMLFLFGCILIVIRITIPLSRVFNKFKIAPHNTLGNTISLLLACASGLALGAAVSMLASELAAAI